MMFSIRKYFNFCNKESKLAMAKLIWLNFNLKIYNFFLNLITIACLKQGIE